MTKSRILLLAAVVLAETCAAMAATRYVNVNNSTPASPFTDWGTAAINIQDAVDIANAGDLILVTDGVYQTGGRVMFGAMTNRLAVTKAVTVRSVNGPEVTVIRGYQVPGTTLGDAAIRCVYLTNGAVLSGFTLTNGATRSLGDEYREQSGGGVWCESSSATVSNCVLAGNVVHYAGGGAYRGTFNTCMLSGNRADWAGGGVYGSTLTNCILSGNQAEEGGGAGSSMLSGCTLTNNWGNDNSGGAYYCTLNNCTLRGNSARWDGGGAYESMLNNCLLSGNVAADGGGASRGTLNNCTLTGNTAGRFSVNPHGGGGTRYSTLHNCILYYNTAPYGANYLDSVLGYCCTLPLAEGSGNITNEPAFVDRLNGNLRLQSNSPCLDAGLNGYAPGLSDLDGNRRIANARVDLGAYELQTPDLIALNSWLRQHGLPADGSADYADPDGDGHSTWQEWRCGTDPTNALSVLRLVSAGPDGANLTVRWQSVAGVSYFFERSTNLGASPRFVMVATNIFGQTGWTSFADTNAVGAGPFFYRIGVGN